MRLRIVTPLSVVVDGAVDSLRAQDASGSFGIRPGHAPFLTALAVSIVSWKTAGVERFCAVRGGVLSVTGGTDIAERRSPETIWPRWTARFWPGFSPM